MRKKEPNIFQFLVTSVLFPTIVFASYLEVSLKTGNGHYTSNYSSSFYSGSTKNSGDDVNLGGIVAYGFELNEYLRNSFGFSVTHYDFGPELRTVSGGRTPNNRAVFYGLNYQVEPFVVLMDHFDLSLPVSLNVSFQGNRTCDDACEGLKEDRGRTCSTGIGARAAYRTVSGSRFGVGAYFKNSSHAYKGDYDVYLNTKGFELFFAINL